MPPLELALEVTPRARLDVVDVRARAAEVHGDAFAPYSRCLYTSPHTTAGYLPQSLTSRLTARTKGIVSYLDLFSTVFPEGAGYLHDQLELRHELAPAQREVEPTNGDSHLAFIAGGLHACVLVHHAAAGARLLHRSRRRPRGHAAAALDDPRRLRPRDDCRPDDPPSTGVLASDQRGEPEGSGPRLL